MKTDDFITRATNIAFATCKSAGLSDDEYMMFFFETGCQGIERFYRESPDDFQGYNERDFMTSNVYWYWWGQKFTQRCEMFVDTGRQGVKNLEAWFRVTPWPSENTCRQVIMELNIKKQRDEQGSTTRFEAPGRGAVASPTR